MELLEGESLAERLMAVEKMGVLDTADVLVLSSCVQMPSLAAVPLVEKECGLPVVSAAVCTTYQMLRKLGLKTRVPNAGSLLSGKY
jgi:maleate isomerase